MVADQLVDNYKDSRSARRGNKDSRTAKRGHKDSRLAKRWKQG